MDFVFRPRDTVAHISNDNMSTKINMDVVQNLTTALADAFPSKTVYAAFGNHDYYPASQFPVVSNFIYNHTAEMWRRWIVEEEQMRNFRRGKTFEPLPLGCSNCLGTEKLGCALSLSLFGRVMRR